MKFKTLIGIAIPIALMGCSTTNDSYTVKESLDDTPLVVNAAVREVDLTRVSFDALGGRITVTEPKSRANGYMDSNPYIDTEGVNFQIKENTIESFSSKLDPGQVYDPEKITDEMIDLALKRVSLFIDAENLPYDSLTIAVTVHGYADGVSFKPGASIPSPITCDFSLMNASVVDRHGTKTPVTKRLKKGDAITNNKVLAMVRSCYVAKQLQARAGNALYPALVNGAMNLYVLGHTDSHKRGVDVVIKVKSPEL
ncbi:hypothetical protein [Colwellia sp. KU-HH00111]|uniref:hypothetical protein n=1 Tax=Colwellia sp. KU-HH00111 TaxID=3127652 RepID=UPI003365879E